MVGFVGYSGINNVGEQLNEILSQRSVLTRNAMELELLVVDQQNEARSYADVGDTVVGFMVDSVSEVIRLPLKNIESAPAIIADKIGTEYLRGVGKMENRLLILLKLNKVLGVKELQSVQSISSDTTAAATT